MSLRFSKKVAAGVARVAFCGLYGVFCLAKRWDEVLFVSRK